MIGWLLGSSLGRKVISAMALFLGVSLLFLRIFSAGKKAERLSAQGQALKTIRKKLAVDEELTRLGPVARRERLREWARSE